MALIPSNVFRADSTTIPFNVDIEPFDLKLSLPRWNTNALHMPTGGNSVAHAEAFRISGSYCYMADIRADNVERLSLDLTVCLAVACFTLIWDIKQLFIRSSIIWRTNFLDGRSGISWS
jgi:hypothetical protein